MRAARLGVLAVVVGLGLAGCGTAKDGQPDVKSSPANPAPLQTATETIEPAGNDDHDDQANQAAPPVGQAPIVAQRFAAAWIRGDLPADRWWQHVAPWCETGFAAMLRSVDPAVLPATRITGRPTATRPPADGTAVYAVATDAGTLTVTVAVVDGRWLVTGNDYQRAAK